MKKQLTTAIVDGMENGRLMPALEEKEELSKINSSLQVLDCRTEEDIIAKAQDADAILTVGAPMTRRVLEKLPKCQVIIRYGIRI